MKLCSIASGSSGNCIFAGSETTSLLIDAGISGKRVEAGLAVLDRSAKACGLASRENAVSARTTCNTTKFHIFSSYGLTVFLFPQNRRCCRFQNRSGC